MAEAERDEAAALARRLGARHRWIETGELEQPGYVANAPDRCYFCKADLFGRLQAVARAEGYAWVVEGANLDDLGDLRPGAKLLASRECGARCWRRDWTRRPFASCRARSRCRPGKSPPWPAWPRGSLMGRR